MNNVVENMVKIFNTILNGHELFKINVKLLEDLKLKNL